MKKLVRFTATILATLASAATLAQASDYFSGQQGAIEAFSSSSQVQTEIQRHIDSGYVARGDATAKIWDVWVGHGGQGRSTFLVSLSLVSSPARYLRTVSALVSRAPDGKYFVKAFPAIPN